MSNAPDRTIRQDNGWRFDPQVREAFLSSVTDLLEIREEVARGAAVERRRRLHEPLDGVA